MLLGVRDRTSLRWHYASRCARGDCGCSGRPRQPDPAYGVLKLHFRPDRRAQHETRRLPDASSPMSTCFPGSSSWPCGARPRENCSVLEHHGCGLPKLRSFDGLAPYRATSPAGRSTTARTTRRWRRGWPNPGVGPVGVRRRLELQVAVVGPCLLHRAAYLAHLPSKWLSRLSERGISNDGEPSRPTPSSMRPKWA